MLLVVWARVAAAQTPCSILVSGAAGLPAACAGAYTAAFAEDSET